MLSLCCLPMRHTLDTNSYFIFYFQTVSVLVSVYIFPPVILIWAGEAVVCIYVTQPASFQANGYGLEGTGTNSWCFPACLHVSYFCSYPAPTALLIYSEHLARPTLTELFLVTSSEADE